jgi:hypothetical protein
MTEGLTLELPIAAGSPKRARDGLRELCPDLDQSALIDAEWMLSELIVDALRYAPDPELTSMTLHAERHDDSLQVSVSNGSAAFRLLSRRPQPGEPGWGIHLVGLLAAQWGLRRDSRGGDVWFQVPLARA